MRTEKTQYSMNASNLFLTLIMLAALSFSSMTRVPETITITLNVDTRTINPSNLEEVCNFGQGEGVSNEDYTVEARLGDIIVWQGVSSTAPDTDEVQIKAINHEGGARVFSKNVLKDTRENPGIVMGVVSEGKDGEEEKYKVQFRVLNDGEKRGGTFNIDPKIRIIL